MTVERLIELLQREYPQALVFVQIHPCPCGALVNHRPDALRGAPVAVYEGLRDGGVYIEAHRHDC